MRRPFLGLMLANLAMEVDIAAAPDRQFLLANGWLPMGKGTNGHEGWGKIINGKPVVVDQPEALEIAKGGRK